MVLTLRQIASIIKSTKKKNTPDRNQIPNLTLINFSSRGITTVKNIINISLKLNYVAEV